MVETLELSITVISDEGSMAPSEATSSEIDELFILSRKGTIAELSKQELEHYAAVLVRQEARSKRGGDEFKQVADTVRTLLIVRMSEEANKEATRISKIAYGLQSLP